MTKAHKNILGRIEREIERVKKTICYRGVMVHALYFLSRERGKTLKRECPTCDKKRGEGKGKMDHRPLDEKWTLKPVFILSSNKKYSACIVTSR